MRSKIFISKVKKLLMKKNHFLVVLSILHTLIGFIVFTCILSYSFNIDLPSVDLISALVPISFIIFKRCVHLDIHDYIKGNEILPEYTEDGYFFNILQRMLFRTEIMSKTHLKDFKGGDVRSVEHFCNLEDEQIIKDIFNEKTHYITINSMIIIILLTKYEMKSLIPFYLGWFFYHFSS